MLFVIELYECLSQNFAESRECLFSHVFKLELQCRVYIAQRNQLARSRDAVSGVW